MGEVKIFLNPCETNTLHSVSALKSRIQVYYLLITDEQKDTL